jgi:hypothetical protein
MHTTTTRCTGNTQSDRQNCIGKACGEPFQRRARPRGKLLSRNGYGNLRPTSSASKQPLQEKRSENYTLSGPDIGQHTFLCEKSRPQFACHSNQGEVRPMHTTTTRCTGNTTISTKKVWPKADTR